MLYCANFLATYKLTRIEREEYLDEYFIACDVVISVSLDISKQLNSLETRLQSSYTSPVSRPKQQTSFAERRVDKSI